HPGPCRVEQLQIEPVPKQERCTVHAELETELTVTFLGIELPDLLAVEIEAGQVAAGDERPDVLAVGTGRGRGGVALVAHGADPGGTQLALPQFLAVGADAQQDDVVVSFFAGEEEAVAPDGGSGAARARQRQFPNDVLARGPLGGEVGFLANAVVLGAAPLRPVVGPGGGPQ